MTCVFLAIGPRTAAQHSRDKVDLSSPPRVMQRCRPATQLEPLTSAASLQRAQVERCCLEAPAGRFLLCPLRRRFDGMSRSRDQTSITLELARKADWQGGLSEKGMRLVVLDPLLTVHVARNARSSPPAGPPHLGTHAYLLDRQYSLTQT